MDAWCQEAVVSRFVLYLSKTSTAATQRGAPADRPSGSANEAYEIAKIAGLKLAAAYHAQYGFSTISLMPTNLYGPGDNFDLESWHVLPAMIRRFYEAKMSGAPSVTFWGTGTPRREFLHVDDLVNAACFLMENYHAPDLLNVVSARI